MGDRIRHQHEFRVKPLEANWVKVVQVIALVGQCKTGDLNEGWVDARVFYDKIKACLLLFCLSGVDTSSTYDLNLICLAT